MREVDRMKDEFVSIVSHELRTPLTSIRGSVQLVLDDAGRCRPRASPAAADRAEQLRAAGAHHQRHPRRLENRVGQPDAAARRPLQVADLAPVGGCRRRPGAGRRMSRSTSTCRPNMRPVMVDPDRIVQALVNLLSNAVKFAPADSTVTVTVTGSDHMITHCRRRPGRRHRAGEPQSAVPEIPASRQLIVAAQRRHRPRPRDHEGAGRAARRPHLRRQRAQQGHAVLVHAAGRDRRGSRRGRAGRGEQGRFRPARRRGASWSLTMMMISAALMRTQLSHAGYVVLDARDAASALHDRAHLESRRDHRRPADARHRRVDVHREACGRKRAWRKSRLWSCPARRMPKTDAAAARRRAVIAKGEGHDRLLREMGLGAGRPGRRHDSRRRRRRRSARGADHVADPERSPRDAGQGRRRSAGGHRARARRPAGARSGDAEHRRLRGAGATEGDRGASRFRWSSSPAPIDRRPSCRRCASGPTSI